jgi:hypothetical protein
MHNQYRQVSCCLALVICGYERTSGCHGLMNLKLLCVRDLLLSDSRKMGRIKVIGKSKLIAFGDD